MDRFDDLRDRLRLEHETTRVRTQHLRDQAWFIDHRQAEHAAARLQLVELAGQADSRNVRHQDVDECDIDRLARSEVEGLPCRTGLADNLDVTFLLKRDREPTTNQWMVVDDQDSQTRDGIHLQ